ncbi:unnamed protein product [Ilex paraguariensis]|uniref:Uncharacterized protein n=1 Tax=Ilex paraguariensis TaxID=185542 RepID=A0ABC8V2V4_9AQUA
MDLGTEFGSVFSAQGTGFSFNLQALLALHGKPSVQITRLDIHFLHSGSSFLQEVDVFSGHQLTSIFLAFLLKTPPSHIFYMDLLLQWIWFPTISHISLLQNMRDLSILLDIHLLCLEFWSAADVESSWCYGSALANIFHDGILLQFSTHRNSSFVLGFCYRRTFHLPYSRLINKAAKLSRVFQSPRSNNNASQLLSSIDHGASTSAPLFFFQLK